MAITKDFIETIKAGKMMRVRIMLKDSLLVDPTGVQFDEMEKQAVQVLGDIYTEHNGEKLNYDVTVWNEDYLNEQMVAVVNSFSKERIDLLKNMVRYLYKDKVDKIRSVRGATAPTSTVTRKQVGAGVTVAGAALTVAGICAAHTALAIGGVVVASVGVVLIVSDKGNVQ